MIDSLIREKKNGFFFIKSFNFFKIWFFFSKSAFDKIKILSKIWMARSICKQSILVTSLPVSNFSLLKYSLLKDLLDELKAYLINKYLFHFNTSIKINT